MAQGYGEYDTLISHKRHKIVKISLPRSKIVCQKIFTFAENETRKLDLYRDHFENVRDWMRLRYSGKSLLRTMEKIQMKANNSSQPNLFFIKAATEYTSFPNLQSYYQRVQNKEKEKIPENFNAYMYYFEQFFQIVVRGGFIPNFFYTPKNIFINRPPSLHNCEIGRFSLNYISTVGLEMLYLQQHIIKDDLQEIFPLLPTNLKILIGKNMNDFDFVEINKIIRMKALAWNLLCFLIGYVPHFLIKNSINTPTVLFAKVLELIDECLIKNMEQLLNASKEKIQKVQTQTGIDFGRLFRDILINNCQKVTWSSIYTQIFLENTKAKNQRIRRQAKYKKVASDNGSALSQKTLNMTNKVSQNILRSYWQWQTTNINVKKFYFDRSIPEASIIYFLVRTNINFRSMMKHLNVLQFIDQTQFSPDTYKVHLTFIEAVIDKTQGDKQGYLMPYGQQRISAPFRTTEEGQMYVRINDPLQLMEQGMNRTVTVQDKKIVISHYTAEMLSQVQRRLWSFD